MVILQGDVFWADLDEPVGSSAGYRRPVVVVQGDPVNKSRISTVVCVPLTSNIKWASAPGNVLLKSRFTGLPKDSVANVSLILSLDKAQLIEKTGQLSSKQVSAIVNGINILLAQ